MTLFEFIMKDVSGGWDHILINNDPMNDYFKQEELALITELLEAYVWDDCYELTYNDFSGKYSRVELELPSHETEVDEDAFLEKVSQEVVLWSLYDNKINLEVY